MKDRTGLQNMAPGRVVLLNVLVWVTGSLFAIDWPRADAQMTGNFGLNNGGLPLLGTIFEAPGPIRAADDGEFLYVRAGGAGASRLPSPLGAWIAMDHGDGIVSIYGRFDDTVNAVPPGKVSRGSVIASAGRSGWSGQEGFYFSVFDRKERRWVNPSMIISPQGDAETPVIQSVELKNREGRSVNPAQTRNISQGYYVISVNTSVSPPDRELALAPYRILCSVNGVEIGALNFETFSARDGVLMAYRNGLLPVKQIYAPYPGFEAGEVWFTRGQAILEVIAQDIRGNTKSLTFYLQID